MNGFYKRLIGNSVFANVVLVSLVAMGIVAISSIRRESNPDVNIPAIDVRVPYPGADPEEVEEGVSQKLEAAIDGLQGVKRYFTTSQNAWLASRSRLTPDSILAKLKTAFVTPSIPSIAFPKAPKNRV